MDRKINKMNLFLWSGVIILIILYTISYSKTGESSSFSSRKSFPLSLVDPDTVCRLDRIEFSGSCGEFFLSFEEGGFWRVYADGGDFIPADMKKVDALVAELSARRDVFAVAERNSMSSDGFFPEGRTVSVRCFSGGKAAAELEFGSEDFSGTSVYFAAGAEGPVCETGASVSLYVFSPAGFWCDPGLVSQVVSGGMDSSDVQRISVESGDGGGFSALPPDIGFHDAAVGILRLRHGGFPSSDAVLSAFTYGEPLLRVRLEKGDGLVYELAVFGSEGDASYSVMNRAVPGSGAFSEVMFFTRISRWTFASLFGYASQIRSR